MSRVAVIQGGPSSEAEVSRASARGVLKALEESGHQVTIFELEPPIAERLRRDAFDVVFPVVHGAVGEDGSLQGLLEVLELPYVGSDVLASALAMSKAVARIVLGAAGCPLARGVAAKRSSGEALTWARRARTECGASVVVKPSSSGSAIGVARFEASASDGQIASAIDAAWQLDDTAVIEAFVKGREVTCSVLDVGGTARMLAATEITSPNDAFYTYEARYAPGRSVHKCPVDLGELTNGVERAALLAHSSLGCRDLSRVDFIVAHESFVVLEVNTMPGMTETSLYPEAARAVGISFPSVCDMLVQNSLARGSRRRNAPRPFPT